MYIKHQQIFQLSYQASLSNKEKFQVGHRQLP